MIIPAILTDKFEEFEKQAKILAFSPIIQIDIMDGELVEGRSFLEIEKINNIQITSDFELHLMVARPLLELKKWQQVKNIKRVIFHLECEDSPNETALEIKKLGYEVGLAINPETDFRDILPFLNNLDEILFMTVHPGKQGAAFVPDVIDKIKEFKKLVDSKEIDIKIGADGGINKDNILDIKNAGVENFCIGSAIIKDKNPEQSYQELNKIISYV